MVDDQIYENSLHFEKHSNMVNKWFEENIDKSHVYFKSVYKFWTINKNN